jgi:hypothetical protein
LSRASALTGSALIVVLATVLTDPGWYEELTRKREELTRAVTPHPPVRSGPIGDPIMVTPVHPTGNDSSVSATPQSLLLVRTQPGRNSLEGFAQIGISARSPQTYAAGAVLANGARLAEIYDRYVVLERAGQSVRLYMQGSPEADRHGRESSPLARVGGPVTRPSIDLNPQPRLTDYLRPSPVFGVGGTTRTNASPLRGYALYPGRKSAVFSAWGLNAGDVVTQINGSPVTIASLETLMEGAALTAHIERDGMPKVMSLDGSVLLGAIAREASGLIAASEDGTQQIRARAYFKVPDNERILSASRVVPETRNISSGSDSLLTALRKPKTLDATAAITSASGVAGPETARSSATGSSPGLRHAETTVGSVTSADGGLSPGITPTPAPATVIEPGAFPSPAVRDPPTVPVPPQNPGAVPAGMLPGGPQSGR